MFDPDTVALISSAPRLDGLDLADLPRRLTEAFAAIVSARIRLRAGAAAVEVLPDDVTAVVQEMRRLALSQEALVAVSTNRENRAGAAFVAGAAHHVALMADRFGRAEPRPTTLGPRDISPEVSAALLFLIAEASADAAEMAKAFVIRTDDVVEAGVLKAIVYLATGQLPSILELPLPSPERFLRTEGPTQATRTLYYLLFHGIRAVAARLLGNSEVSLLERDPQVLFDRVMTLGIDRVNWTLDRDARPAFSAFPGPLHLASLLSSAARDLATTALVNVPPPQGIPAARWLTMMREIATRRPYLWRNHRQAVDAGYLQPGVSAAVSFPTGAGKSTIAELKVAVALLRGSKVVFLAPTLALVDQTARSLAATFPSAEVQRERAEEALLDFDQENLPAISVMTPERCLAMLSFDRHVFSDVGLLIFDECHLMHPRDTDRSRRAIDAMLCVLNFTSGAPEADLLLLSAMMANGNELARWLESLTGRRCLSLALMWKPTRQVRGCVVYGKAEIDALNARLRQTRRAVTNVNPPAQLRRSLSAKPFGFFCLRQTWQSRERRDYALLPLLEDSVLLATGTARDRNWYLTPNGNKVATVLAVATARKQLKTLVFVQTIPLADSAASAIAGTLGPPDVEFNQEERRLYEAAVDEAGGPVHVYIQVDAANAVALQSSCACHHGLLLSPERHLHESLFKRQDGIHVLVATSTLAQGMNLPSQVVIIGGDSRFDDVSNRMQQLEAHELLNAAGRAGRAGEASNGFVLVVPSKVVHFDESENRIHSHWSSLQAIFAQSDQCLVIDDPMTAVLDQLHDASEPSSTARYFIKRLPVEESEGDAPARALIERSFAAFRARARGDGDWLISRIEAALRVRANDPEVPALVTWEDRLAASAGVPVSVIRELAQQLSGGARPDATVIEWREWLKAWLVARPQILPQLIRRESLEGLFGADYKALASDEQRGQHVAIRLFNLLERWMAGSSLAEMEQAFGTAAEHLGKCQTAREFVLRIVPELAYIFGLPAQIFPQVRAQHGVRDEGPLTLRSLGACVREGFDNIEKLALRHLRRNAFRRAIHREFPTLLLNLHPAVAGEGFNDVILRVRRADTLTRS